MSAQHRGLKVTASWGASGNFPATYLIESVDPDDDLSKMYLSTLSVTQSIPFRGFSQLKVKFPAALPGTANHLVFYDDSSDDGSFSTPAQDLDGNTITVASVQSSLGASRPVSVDLSGSFYLRPAFRTSGNALIVPGVLSLEFWLSE